MRACAEVVLRAEEQLRLRARVVAGATLPSKFRDQPRTMIAAAEPIDVKKTKNRERLLGVTEVTECEAGTCPELPFVSSGHKGECKIVSTKRPAGTRILFASGLPYRRSL
jgi:hypothetical protein